MKQLLSGHCTSATKESPESWKKKFPVTAMAFCLEILSWLWGMKKGPRKNLANLLEGGDELGSPETRIQRTENQRSAEDIP